MIHFGPNLTDDEIFRFVEGWIDLLVDEKYEAAFAATAHDPYYQWTPDLMRDVIAGYGLPDPHPSGVTFRVTPRSTAGGGPPQRFIERFDDCEPPFWEVGHDLPLNGEWSDLTVTFRMDPCPGGYTVTLEEIHVF